MDSFDDVIKELDTLLIKNIVEPTLKVADKYNLDRDATLRSVSDVLVDTTSMATFKYYKFKEEEN